MGRFTIGFVWLIILSACTVVSSHQVPAVTPVNSPSMGVSSATLPVSATHTPVPGTPSDLVSATLTVKVPASRTAAAVQATLSLIAPTVRAELTGTAEAKSIPNKEQFCPIDQSTCILPGHFLMQRPISPAFNASEDQTYRYGSTQDGKREPHHGIEFPNAQGTPVLSVANGKVVFAGDDLNISLAWVPSYYGNVVVIEHTFSGIRQPVYSLYAHLYKIGVAEGQLVQSGDQIGEVGATGTAIGSHLHFEVRIGENKYLLNRNPVLWLQPPAGMGVIVGRLQDLQGRPVKGMVNVQRIENGVLNPLPVTALNTYETNELQPVGVDDIWNENFASGEIPEGTYRLSLHYNGTIHEEVVQIERGKLTFVRFVLK